MLTRYLEVTSETGDVGLLRLDSVRFLKRAQDGSSVVDGMPVREPYELLADLIRKDERRFVMDSDTDFRVRELARTSIYAMAKEFGEVVALRYIGRVALAESEADVDAARRELYSGG